VNVPADTGTALVEAHQRANRNLRIVSIVFPIAFAALIVWNLVGIGNLFRSIDGPAVGTELSNRMNVLMPDVDNELGDVADAVQPALYGALETESSALAPQIEERLRADVDHTMAEAKAALEAGVDRALSDEREAQRAKLLERFPELTSDPAAQEVVLSAARDAAREWSAAQLDALVAEHLQAMERLHKTLQSSYTKPHTASADPEDALMALLNLMNEHLGGGDEVLAVSDGKPAARGKSTGKK